MNYNPLDEDEDLEYPEIEDRSTGSLTDRLFPTDTPFYANPFCLIILALVVCFVLVVVVLIFSMSFSSSHSSPPVYDSLPPGSPLRLSLSLPLDGFVDSLHLPTLSTSSPRCATLLTPGASRVVEVLFHSADDDLFSPQYHPALYRHILWQLLDPRLMTPVDCLKVDPFGRLDALNAPCVAVLRVSLLSETGHPTSTLSDNRTICVSSPIAHKSAPSNPAPFFYQSTPIQPATLLQKVVTHYTADDFALLRQNPLLSPPGSVWASLADPWRCAANASSPRQTSVLSPPLHLQWTVRPYADGSPSRSYVLLFDPTSPRARDAIQHLVGNRYLPGDGLCACFLAPDTSNGVWIVGAAADRLTHVAMKPWSFATKAAHLTAQTQQSVLRYGLASGADWDGHTWRSEVSDNDGLWTSILKAVLLLAHISGRQGTVNASIRHLSNTRRGAGNLVSDVVLRADRTLALDDYVGSPARPPRFSGIDAGLTVDGLFLGDSPRFSLHPLNLSDWVDPLRDPAAAVATTPRSLAGFIARTFVIPAVDGEADWGGVFFRRHASTPLQSVLFRPHVLYLCAKADDNAKQFELPLGDLPLPEPLSSVLLHDGVQFSMGDVAYKGDTSTDEIIGHLFLWKVAFDILSPDDPEEAALRQLVADTAGAFASHILANGYQLVDGTGQGTRWGKQTRSYFNSDFTIEDAPLNAMVLLLTFKVAHHCTGLSVWEQEYQALLDAPYSYADLAAQYLPRWQHIALNDDEDVPHLDPGFNHTDAEILRHIQYLLNYSDQEMAMLAFYLLFSMEANPLILAKYRQALDGWWKAGISKSKNPLWYLIYQLCESLDTPQVDDYGENLIEAASWALSRHPTDMRAFQAFVPGARSDVLQDRFLTVDPWHILGSRATLQDVTHDDIELNSNLLPSYNPRFVYDLKILPPDERALRKYNGASFESPDSFNVNYMEPATTFTLPYWLAIYHQLIVFN